MYPILIGCKHHPAHVELLPSYTETVTPGCSCMLAFDRWTAHLRSFSMSSRCSCQEARRKSSTIVLVKTLKPVMDRFRNQSLNEDVDILCWTEILCLLLLLSIWNAGADQCEDAFLVGATFFGHLAVWGPPSLQGWSWRQWSRLQAQRERGGVVVSQTMLENQHKHACAL